ncbi:MAG: alpha/beta fold hydrolase [Gemmatimonadaceae bacterium]
MRKLFAISTIAFAATMLTTTNAMSQTLPTGVTERSITVSGPVPLAGTLTLPAGAGPFPGVVLVHGSGGGDRDETIGGNKTFRDLAWGLAAKGVAVLRYDKRSNVAPMWFTKEGFTVSDETIDDAVSALGLLRQQAEVNKARTYVLGHSLGGMVAPRIAKADGKIAGLIIMAGATELNLGEQMDRQYDYIISISGADSDKVRKVVEPARPGIARIRSLTAADANDTKPIPGMGGTSPKYWVDLATPSPATEMRTVSIPSLVLQGMRDYQVTPDQLEVWLKAVGPRKNMTVIRYPSLTHLFTSGEGTPRPQEYAVPKNVDPQVSIDIAEWIRKN